MAVGYGFFVEMTHEEALRFIEKKTSQLTMSVPHSSWLSCPYFYNSSVNALLLQLCPFVQFRFTEQLTKDSAKIKANIQMVLEVSSLCGGCKVSLGLVLILIFTQTFSQTVQKPLFDVFFSRGA